MIFLSLILLVLWDFSGISKFGIVKCGSSSNGREGDSVDNGVKSVERLLEEKGRAELSSRIASGEFTVQKSG